MKVDFVCGGEVETREMPTAPRKDDHVQFTEDHRVWNVEGIIWVFNDFAGECDCVVSCSVLTPTNPIPVDA